MERLYGNSYHGFCKEEAHVNMLPVWKMECYQLFVTWCCVIKQHLVAHNKDALVSLITLGIHECWYVVPTQSFVQFCSSLMTEISSLIILLELGWLGILQVYWVHLSLFFFLIWHLHMASTLRVISRNWNLFRGYSRSYKSSFNPTSEVLACSSQLYWLSKLGMPI